MWVTLSVKVGQPGAAIDENAVMRSRSWDCKTVDDYGAALTGGSFSLQQIAVSSKAQRACPKGVLLSEYTCDEGSCVTRMR